MLRRFYVPHIDGSAVALDPEQARHAQRTLRLQPGDAVELFDGRGAVARGRLEGVGKATAVAVESLHRLPPPCPDLAVAVAVPKGARADAMVEGLVQVGVNRIVPLLCERSVVEPGEGKQRRFERIAVEAAKQSGRAHLPRIDAPTELASALHAWARASPPDNALRLVADAPAGAADAPAESDENQGAAPRPRPLQMMHRGHDSALRGAMLNGTESVRLLVGPEGGWTDGERDAARAAGFEPWRFNPFVLRVETAAVVAAGLVRAMAMSPSGTGKT